MRYELIDHTADMMVKAYGDTLEECFANAAYALFDQTVDLSNIGTDEEPRWYHFDCTHLRAAYSHSGCLLTDQQIKAFNRFRSGFYAYDSSKYPATDKTIITPTPDLEKFY